MTYECEERKKLEYHQKMKYEIWQKHKDDSSYLDLELASRNLINWHEFHLNDENLDSFDEALEYIKILKEDYHGPLEEMKNESKKISKSITSLKNDIDSLVSQHEDSKLALESLSDDIKDHESELESESDVEKIESIKEQIELLKEEKESEKDLIDTLNHDIGAKRIEYYQECESYFDSISEKLEKIEL